MKGKAGRYSVYIRPFTYAADLFSINFLAFLMLPEVYFSAYFLLVISLSWIIIALNTNWKHASILAFFSPVPSKSNVRTR